MRTVQPSRNPILFTLCALLFAALPLAAGAAEVPADFNPFGEVVDVRLINVEVVVTDRQGNRVHDLAAADFRLLVDGEEVPLDFFTEVRDRRAVESAAPGTPAAPAGETVGTSYLVYVDDYFPLQRDRNKVLDQLAEQLSALGPADRMAIVAYDDRQLELVSGWSSSEAEIAAALERAQERPAYGLRQLAEQRNHDRTLALSTDARSGDSLLTVGVEDRFFASEVARKVERSVAAASASLRGFASAPGRKVMLLLSGGWPYSPVQYVARNQAVLATGQLADGESILRPLVDTANRLGYTVYPVDVPGLARVAGADVERGGLIDPLSGNANRFDQFSSSAFSDREGSIEDTLRHVAQETGGRPLINSRRLSALPEVSSDVGNYYWLGFTPPGDADDRRHRVRVVVDAPGVRVRARKSYFDLTATAERTMAVESALIFGGVRGLDLGAASGLVAELGDAERGGRRVEVPIVVHIPTDMLTAVPEGDEWLARVELRVGSRDGRGRVSDVAAAPVELRFPEDPKPGRTVTYRGALRLRNADQMLIVQVTDPVGGVTRTTEAQYAKQ
ncbi:MAG TPA: VWA domain-containing protein [Thermoanaerobaculia bacterium]|nr:VWA domain-containing protein [Thermoanaerobaculia bacterium]